MKSSHRFVSGILAISASAATSASAAILISDNFDDVASAANINGRTPSFVDGSLSGVSWLSSTANYLGSGTGGLSVSMTTATNRSIGFDMGANYFSSNAGVHEISLSIQRTSDSSSLSWVGLGFSSTLDVASNMTTEASAGQPWMLNRMSGSTVVYQGPRATNSFANTTTANMANANTFTLRLDTSGVNWTLAAFINGVPMDLNGAVGGETTFTYVTNPDAIRYLVLSNGYNTSQASALIDNFSYSFVAVPEPSSALLGGLAGLVFFRRRR